MSLLLKIIILLYLLCIYSIPGEKCNFNVKIGHTLHNNGFHRILNYNIDLASEDKSSRFLYDDCMVGIEQTLPAGVFASPDEVKGHKCTELIYSLFKTPVNTELFAEDATPMLIQLFGHVTNNRSRLHIYVPVHARYHRAKTGGRPVRYDIPHPKLYISCPNNKLDDCGDFYSGLSETNSFCQQHVSLKNCQWKQIPADVVTPPLYWYVVVGSPEHYYLVTFGTTLVIVAGSLYLLKTIHEYKMRVERSKRKGKGI